jgi:hypothetical protein
LWSVVFGSAREALVGLKDGQSGIKTIDHLITREGVQVGLIELLLIVLVIAAIAGGIGVSPFLWLLLLIAAVILLTSGGFGYRRGGRL